MPAYLVELYLCISASWRLYINLIYSLQEAEIASELKDLVYVDNMHCNESIQKFYYSAKFEDICASNVPPWLDSEPLV